VIHAAPVVGVAIAVALVLPLATVVTMVVLGADEATDDRGPKMEFAFEYDAEVDPPTEVPAPAIASTSC
jgi:hypothetical protein